MIGRLLGLIERRRAPAIVLWNERCFPNAAAKRAFGERFAAEDLSRIAAVRDHAIAERRIRDFEIEGSTLQIVPLSFEEEPKLAVAVADLRTEEFPEFYADVVGFGTFASQIVQFLPQPVFSARTDGRVDFISRSWQERTGVPVHAPSIDTLAAALPDAERLAFVQAWNNGVARALRFKIEMQVRTADGLRWQIFEAVPVKNARERVRKWLGTVTDVDEARRATGSLEESESRLRFLEEAGRAVAESLDIESIVAVACRELVGPFADGVAIECSDAFDKRMVCGEGCKAWDVIALRKELFGETPSSSHYASLRSGALAHHALISMPIRSGRRDVGMLNLVINPSRGSLSADDLAVLSIFGRRIGTAIENGRLYARERRVAETLQDALLPQNLPLLAGVQFDTVYLPNTDEAKVGGDWYDAFELGDGRSAISIGDVAGHGLFAATVMGSVRTALRAAALNGETPDAVLTRANRLLYSESRTMVTALFGIIDVARKTFRYAVAGHPPPLLLRRDGSVRALSLGGPPLGIMRDLELSERVEPLGVDETLLLYTDGIIEFERDAIAGERRLNECAARWAHAGRPGGVGALAREVLARAERRDDVAMLAATLLPENVIDVTLPAEPQQSSLVRETVREFAVRCDVDPARLDDLILGVGEAVNNAIVHAYDDRPGTIRVRAKRENAGLVVEVLDNGRWRPKTQPPAGATGETALAEHGRGLMLMRSLADGVNVESGAHGTCVRLTLT